MANKRRVLAMADAMAAQARERFFEVPDWAGLAWIIDPGWNWGAERICASMGAVWTERAERLCRALTIACRRG